MWLKDIYKLREVGSADEALQLVRERLQSITAKDGEIWRHLMHLGANCFLDLKQYNEGEKWFGEVWKTMRDPIALANRGGAKWMQGNAEGALRDYLAAISLHSPGESVELELRKASQLYLELGDTLNALKYLNECEHRYGKSRKTRDIRRRIENYCAS